MPIWNPWHDCHKISPGCANCYVHWRDENVDRDASIVSKTGDFNLLLKRNLHATACCCRSCIEKWHHIPSGKILTPQEQEYIVNVLMKWILLEIKI